MATRWANAGSVQGQDLADPAARDGRVRHVNSVQNVIHAPASQAAFVSADGVIRFRFQDFRRMQVPVAVRHYARGSVNAFGEPLLRGTTG